MSKIDQAKITELLAIRHSEDVFIPQCKTGPSWGALKLGIFDAWAFNKSWANFNCSGYEIKTSRRDFLSDTKWPKYLPYCHSFYFVCPSGVIKPEECPENAGLLYVSKTGTRLFTKVRAKRRDVEIPQEIMIYVLMSRARITEEDPYPRKTTKRFWEEWLKGEEINCRYGYNLGKRIQQKIEKSITKVSEENEQLKKDIDRANEFKEVAAKLGINFNAWDVEDELKEKKKEFETGVKQNFIDSVDGLARDIRHFYNSVGVKEELIK